LDEALPSETASRVRLIKMDVQGFESHVMRGMAQTLDRNPGVIVFAELFPLGLRDAESSPAEFLAVAADLGLKGFEFNDYRIAPIAPTWMYDQFRGRREENLILCRDETRLAEVVGRYLGSPV
jgi:hypothetical protein